ncbi:uncharacterized protein EMH_0046690 [Eimeria mitis]|uniref:Uncharacterized protein n=1 Tax=Eimeria mitis TaxID=44415 RepID=U6KJ55_9EIME|nr:uncharacterized protein EMH_0046690 [Eimeria mitis]CDJ36307.1 hypothetical protein EMH_0046690 [Eimeria mitis]
MPFRCLDLTPRPPSPAPATAGVYAKGSKHTQQQRQHQEQPIKQQQNTCSSRGARCPFRHTAAPVDAAVNAACRVALHGEQHPQQDGRHEQQETESRTSTFQMDIDTQDVQFLSMEGQM